MLMKNRSNIASSILLNPELLEDVYKRAQNSAGSAQQELDKYLESIEGHISRFQNQLQELYAALIDSGLLKDIIDFGTEFLEILTNIVQKGGLPAVLSMLGGIGGALHLIKKPAQEVTNELRTLKDLFNGQKKLKDILGFAEVIPEIVTTTDSLDDMTLTASEMANGVASAETAIANAEKTVANATPKVVGLTSAFSALLPILIGIGAIYLGYKAWDELSLTVQEAEKDLEEVSGTIESLKGQIEELENIDYRTSAQEERLNGLRDELEIAEQIYAVRQKTVLGEKYGTKFTDQDDENNYRTRLTQDTNLSRKGSSAYLLSINDSQTDKIKEYNEEIEQYRQGIENLQQQMANGSISEGLGNNQIKDLEKRLDKVKSKLNEINKGQEQTQADIAAKIIDYSEAIEDMKSDIEFMESDKESLFTSEDINEAKKALKLYEAQLDRLRKAHGTYAVEIVPEYDYSSVIESAFEHVEFKNLKDELIQMGKDGTLSIEYIAQAFGGKGGLLEVMGLTADQAEVLYTYLMNLADPYKNEKQALAQNIGSQLKADKNVRGNGKKRGQVISNTKQIQDYLDSLTDEEYELIAGLDIDWSTFDADQAIDRMNDELKNAGPAEVDVEAKLDQSKFSEQVNKLDALQSAYNSFRDNVNNEETKINLDISDVEQLREDFGAIEGFNFDAFELVVTSDTSGIDDIQNAFDDALTAYANYQIELQGINESNKEMIRTQLEMEGATSESAEAFVEHALDIAQAEDYAADNAIDLANATTDEISAFYAEAAALGIDSGALTEYMMLKAQANGGIWNLNLEALASEYEELGLNCDKLREYIALKNAAGSSGNFIGQFTSAQDFQNYQKSMNAAQQEIEQNMKNRPVEFKLPEFTRSGGGGGAGKAGSDAGKAYKEAFDEELSKLKESYERGEMTLGEYLDRYKALINKYFSDTEKYAEERAEALHQYMEELRGYYDSAISGVVTLIDHRINAVSKEKDAALKAIEDERKAAKASYEERKKQIEAEIKAKEKEIKALEDAKKPLEDEIKAIQDANAERDRQNNLMEKQYNLQKMMNQRVNLIYKGNQLVYESDTSNIRDAREELNDAKDEIRIAALQKQIDALDKQIELKQEEIDLLNEESALIDEQLASIDEFYDNLVEETTAAFDAILEQLENQKSKWEELAEINQIATAYSQVKDVMDMLGISMNDILSDAPGAFEAFKGAYIDMLAGANAENANFLEGLGYATEQSINSTKAVGQALAGVSDEAAQPIKDMADSIGDIGTNASSASVPVSNLATNASTLANASTEAKDGITGISTGLSQIDSTALDSLKLAIEQVRDLINGPDNSLVTAINGLGDQVDLEPIVTKFTDLKGAVNNVITALGGGGGGEEASSGGFAGNSNAQVSAMQGSSEGSGSGLTGAIEAVKKAADTNIGTGGGEGGESGEGGEGGGTAISDFEALGSAVNNVTAAINGGGGGGGESGSGGFAGNTNAQASAMQGEGGGDLVSAVKEFGEVNHAVIIGGDQGEGAVGDWTTFNEQLAEAEEHITGMVDGLNNLEDSYDTKLTVTLSIEGGGEYTGTATVNGGHARYSFNVMEAIGLPSEGGEWANLLQSKSGKARFTGTANFGGNWGFEGGKTMLAEIGPEVVVTPDGKYTVYDKPQIVNLPKNSIIFNHLQTEEILNPKNQVRKIGKSNAQGTVPNGIVPLSQYNPEQFAIFTQLAEQLKSNTQDMMSDLSKISYSTDDISRAVQNITNNNNSNATTITFGDLNFTCTGVTSSEVMSQIGNALEREFSGLALNAYQRAMAH